MARDVKTFIHIPELDGVDGRFQIELSTFKGISGIASIARAQFVRDVVVTYTMFQDFHKTYARSKTRATQKAMEAQHAETFTAERIAEITAEVKAYYASKKAGE